MDMVSIAKRNKIIEKIVVQYITYVNYTTISKNNRVLECYQTIMIG